jgi:hypothetical protein
MQEVLTVFIWTFALGAALAIPMSVRKSAFLCLGWLAFYAVAYAYLSMNGRYAQDTFAGNSRWMPMHCEKIVVQGPYEIPKLNGMGAFFAPLVLADRIIVHQTRDAFDPPPLSAKKFSALR